MRKRVMVTGVYSGNAIKIAITKLSLDKIILIVERDYDCSNDRACITKCENVKKLKEQFKGVLEIELIKIDSLYNIYDIAGEVIKKIDKIPREYDVVIHVSEGRKTLSFALNLSANARKDRISGIYYVVEETNEILKLPPLNFPEANELQIKILKLINRKVIKPDKLIQDLKKSKSVIYQYIKDLQNKGYLEFDAKQLSLTPLGKIKII